MHKFKWAELPSTLHNFDHILVTFELVDTTFPRRGVATLVQIQSLASCVEQNHYLEMTKSTEYLLASSVYNLGKNDTFVTQVYLVHTN